MTGRSKTCEGTSNKNIVPIGVYVNILDRAYESFFKINHGKELYSKSQTGRSYG